MRKYYILTEDDAGGAAPATGGDGITSGEVGGATNTAMDKHLFTGYFVRPDGKLVFKRPRRYIPKRIKRGAKNAWVSERIG